MCLYPKLIRNKKYLPTKKNNYNPPKMVDGQLKRAANNIAYLLERINDQIKIESYETV